MKAIDIINFINEDKFSKYTLVQIYDELGPEDFIDYVAKVCTKIIKSLNNKFHTVVPHIQPGTRMSYPSINYYLSNTEDERFTVVIAFGVVRADPRLEIYYNTGEYQDVSSHSNISGNDTSIINELGLAIKYCYRISKDVDKK